ncbi:MAG: N-carbamoyl-D-amino-acid hydrolase [Planctomycetales bacterium]|nr:N-carbamoyl-D-amino-acid hydrolase [Planctomycetales bacterium]
MPRPVTIAAAQMGPIRRDESRPHVVGRLLALLREAHARGGELVLFPECALTAFFGHWWIDDEAERDAWYESEMPSPVTQPLFDEAARLRIGFCLGYAELAVEAGAKRRFNSSVLVGRDGTIIGKYRKMHLPGHADHRPENPFQNLEKRYFQPGDLGFPVWDAFGGRVGMLICNDRRWPEAYRMLGLQGVEAVLIGYNTPRHYPEYPDTDRLADFHHLLSLQAGAYQNGTWVIAAAKAGIEEGVEQIGSSAIVAPSGEVIARSSTLGDELIIHRCDLDLCRTIKQGVFHPRNRRPEHYGLITARNDE